MSGFDAAVAKFLASYYNSNPVSAGNPGGLDADGHVDNFPAALKDLGEVAQKYSADSAIIQAFGSVAVGAGAFRNLLINGSFDIWQRGTSFVLLAAGDFGADRWRTLSDGGRTHSMSRQAFDTGQTAVPGGPKYWLRYKPTGAGTSGNSIIETTLEGLSRLSGQTVTLSFYAKSPTGSTVTAQVDQLFGTGGSSVISVGGQTNVLSNNWIKYSFILNFPDLTGKIVGAGDYISVVFYTPAGPVDPVIDLANVQLEVGSVATAFEQRPLAVELALCRRYFQIKEATGQATDLAHQMRATPTETGAGPYNYDAEI